MKQKLIIMTKREISRYEYVRKLIDGELNGTEASKLMKLSLRQVKRIKAKVIKFGADGVVHLNRGKESSRKIDEGVLKEVKKYLRENYSDFKPTFASEKLEEINNIKLSKETVRNIMTKEGLWKPKAKKASIYRSWRPRKDCYGEMEQFDGSYHKWFEDRRAESCLLLAIDDAEGKITHAKFDKNEGVKAVFNFWKEYVLKNGFPA